MRSSRVHRLRGGRGLETKLKHCLIGSDIFADRTAGLDDRHQFSASPSGKIRDVSDAKKKALQALFPDPNPKAPTCSCDRAPSQSAAFPAAVSHCAPATDQPSTAHRRSLMRVSKCRRPCLHMHGDVETPRGMMQPCILMQHELVMESWQRSLQHQRRC